MNKKVIFVIITLIVALIAAVYFLYFRKSVELSTYKVSVQVISGTPQFTLETVTSQKQITPAEADSYLIYSFNSTSEILWIDCAEGYRVTNYTDKNGNAVFGDSTTGYGVDVINGKSDQVIIQCTK